MQPKAFKARFCACLWASARGVIDYTRTGNEDYIRLLDEHPDDTEAIAHGIAHKVHPAGIGRCSPGTPWPE